MNSNQKGNIAEQAIALEATRLGIQVLKPIAEHARYDLAFDLGTMILRVQCKWAPMRNDVVGVGLQSSWFSPRGYIRTTYEAHEIDAVAAYCEDIERVYLLPVSLVEGMRMIHLRLKAPKNG
jgi:PD-(D/E)XK nuclease superfamily protein